MSERIRRLRAVVADDEKLALDYLLELLEAHREIEVAAACRDGLEAAKAIALHQPDLVFLDIEMPRLDGFEVLELVERPVAVVFVTAYDGYAVKAFEAHAVDYLLKPVSPERLAAAIAKVRRTLGDAPLPDAAALRREALPALAHVERIAIKDGAEISVIDVRDVDYVRAEDDYVSICAGGRCHLKHQTMEGLARDLDPRRFVRIHRSCIVNVERVVRVEPETKERFSVELRDGTSLNASRERMRRLREVLGL
jgi:two-component system, LytTR family, response regulator